ncbi:hypothetical protein [Allorhodopirellula heiligendammensis]|uniref:Glycosyltransferase RgtA/B/C/D-like domain-containing protein n=1 Tax=Allorhodopirellula heiligendammensis TaxID=2714739 RepID=A0A5C6BV89_9BACT|nr:hypothetical protein [Allorhodopirellula heiligendammensis]TWU15772.1 hypothetical protein Poly21_29740 [Allorhodopirellula heiligendammensis]
MNDQAESSRTRREPDIVTHSLYPSPSFHAIKIVFWWSIALWAMCAVSGRWQPHLVSDSASYLDYPFASLESMARYSRLPAYPALLRACLAIAPSESVGLQLVVLVQILLQAIAVSFFMIEMRRWGLSRSAAIAAAAAVAVGCSFWDHVSTIATDCAAMSWGVITAACILRGWRIGFSTPLAAGVAASSLLSISLRPAYLFLLPWVITMVLFRAGDGVLPPWTRRWRDVAVIGSLPLVVLLGWCQFRYTVANDFSLLPFGHQNMAAVTTQLLDNDELEQMSGPGGALASEIARRRVAVSTGRSGRASQPGTGAIDGLDLRVTSDPSLRADSYMTLENRWDAMTYLVAIPAAIAVAGDDPIDQHRLLAELDRQIVLAYPLRYARWWMLAMRRGIWGSVANIVMHPIFLMVIVLAAGVAMLVCIWPQVISSRAEMDSEPARCSARARRALVLLAISYAATGLAFVALTSPTIGRFSDAAFVFLPSLAALAMVSKCGRLRLSLGQSSR